MTYLCLDDQSRLTYFEAIPFQLQSAAEKPEPVNWSALFKLADLDPAQFQKADPMWASPGAADTRAAWTGTLPERLIRCASKRHRGSGNRYFSNWWAHGPSPPARRC